VVRAIVSSLQFTSTIDISDWLTYEDNYGIYSIKYPSEISEPSQNISGESHTQTLFGNGYVGMAFSITVDKNPDNLSIDEFIKAGGLQEDYLALI